MLMELHNMEIALHKFQDIFDSIGHEVRPYEMQILKASIAYLHYLLCAFLGTSPACRIVLPNI
jgi:hypothetical protein